MTTTTPRRSLAVTPETTSASRHPAVGDLRWQLAAVVALAAASLALPAGLGYDPWAWLVWGREIVDGTFSTIGGPSWKPLPVLVTAPLSLFGDAAPALWTLAARAGGLVMLVFAYRLATRFAGPAAGVVAAATLVLTPDPEARLVRHLSQANIEPLTAALCLWAVERHLDGRHTHAVVLLGVAGLARPEVWPFLLGYAWWLLLRDPRWWRLVVPILVVVPVLWFGGDWLGAGDPLVGAGQARVLTVDTGERIALALRRVAGAVVVPAWIAAAVGLATAVRRRERVLVVIAVCAMALMAEVVAMTVLLGFAGLSRFLQPAVALVCVLAGIGAVRAVAASGDRVAGMMTALRSRSDERTTARSHGRTRTRAVARAALSVVLLAAALPFAAPRVGWLRVQLSDAAERARIDADLMHALDRIGGRDELLACETVVVGRVPTGLESRPSIAWKRELPLASVVHSIRGGPGTALVLTGGAEDEELTSRDDDAAREVLRTDRWAAFAVRCADR